MQTETLFRAAHALRVIGNAITYVAGDRVQFSFHPFVDSLTVILILTEGPVEGEGGLIELVELVNTYARTLGTDGFSLEHLGGQRWKVEAS